MSEPKKKPEIKMLLADVDGTLVDSKKRVTARAAAAIDKLKEAGIGFAVTSGRPPRGMKMIAETVVLSAPVAAFNGGTVVKPDTFDVLESYTLERDVAERVIAAIAKQGLDVWVYAGLEWYLRDINAPHREREEHTVQFPPTVVKDFSAALELGVAKIVGVSDNLELVAKVEKLVQDEFEHDTHTFKATPQRDAQIHADEPSVSAARSQPYYLDVTHPKANKGSVVEMLSRVLSIPMSSIATIGDMPNDVLMFRKGGFSIAMGQANEFVRGNADRISAGLDDEGFAKGVEDFLLGDL